MLKSLNARLVFIRYACLLAALSCVILSYACVASAQWTGNQGSMPLYQGQMQGYAPQATSQALPADWPQPLSVPGMEKVTGLVQGDNNLSYAVHVISQDAGKVNFQVEAFCVANPQSEYAILHVLNKPLVGVVDPEKKTLQIDFSPLATGLDSVEVIDKADVDRVLLQRTDSLVLHTVMAVQSMDASQVKFSLTDMSLLQPDGVLDEFSLPGPVPAVFDPATARFSTVAFDEMTNVLQQNIVYVQQNTQINVVNVVNQVNIINVVDFGGFGCGGWGGVPYGGCGYSGGYPGYGGYGDYGGYGGFMPYSDPLPLVHPKSARHLAIPDDVPVYKARPDLADRTLPGEKLPLKERGRNRDAVAGDTGAARRDAVAKLPATKVASPALPDTTVRAPVKATPKTPTHDIRAPSGSTPIKQGYADPASMQKLAGNTVKTPNDKPAARDAAAKTAVAKANIPDRRPAVQTALQSVPATKSVSAPKTNVVKAPDNAPSRQVTSRSVPSTKVDSTPKTNVARAPDKARQVASNNAPVIKTVSAPKAGGAKTSVHSAPVKQVSAPKASYQSTNTHAPAKAVSHAVPSAPRGATARGGRK